MTISSQTNRSGPYTENGVTTNFGYGFKIEDASHIKVVRAAAGVETILELTTDYTVTGVGNDTGNVVINTPVSGSTLTLVLNVPFTQELDLENQGAYNAEDVEAALDLAVQRDKQLSERLDRAIVVPVSSSAADFQVQIDSIIRLGQSADQIDIVAANIDAVLLVPGYLSDIEASRDAAENFASDADASAQAALASQQSAASFAGWALSYSGAAQGAANTALAAAADAEDLVQQATSGFVGFTDGSGYDFGSITTPTTYFDHDFGSIA